MTEIERSPETLAAMERTMAAEQRLKEDLVRIACWIEASHPECLSALEVQRHYSCEDNEIAHVVPLVKDQATRRLIRGEAEAAFRALGWTIRPEGRDVRSIFGRAQSRSQHERLQAFSEIQKVMRNTEMAPDSDPDPRGTA
ncbi:hypothetical protein [Tropicimonas sp. IMCC34011]|uniref:hypothetical protein n=1 Tax=Tropicimonas sp. IMCC34011 TaxID=2248759 RepID=UPI001300B7D2|nr:hypothetical protein [Tropicimonas sp. IMCC34011]